jgi:futalosine hydrolase
MLIFEICSMQILVVSATGMEITPFLAQNTMIDHLITGVGTAACMYRLLKKNQQKKYDLIIQVGIAGSFDPALSLGKTVLVEKDIFADAGALENQQLFSLFDMGLADKNEWPYRDGWMICENIYFKEACLPKVKAITVNMVTDDKIVCSELLLKYNAAIETMEGAALHYVCLQENINFLQLRSISNEVGERDKNKWMVKEAIKNLNIELLLLLGKIKNL